MVVPNKDAIIAGEAAAGNTAADDTAAKGGKNGGGEGFCCPAPPLYLPPLYLPPLLHDNHLLRKPTPIDDKLIDVDAGCGFTVGLQDLAIPVRRECAGSGRAARQLEVVEILARALQNRHGDELRQHVVNLERHAWPMTIGKQITVQCERDRGRRIERIRIVLLQLHERRGRRLSQDSIYSPQRRHKHSPGVQLHPRLLCERKRCVRQLSLWVQGA